MKKIYLGATFIVISFLGLLVNTTTISACSCLAPASPSEEIEKGQIVFSGKVDNISKRGDLNVTVKMSLSESWGSEKLESNLKLITANNSAACGFEFEEGKEYLVYAYKDGDDLSTGLCTRTTSLASGQEDLSILENMAIDNYTYIQTDIDGSNKDTVVPLLIGLALFVLAGGIVYYCMVIKKP